MSPQWIEVDDDVMATLKGAGRALRRHAERRASTSARLGAGRE